ncbi:high nitrogen upregulated cytochrome P450 monooxygenase 2 [Trametes cingulata]|nr:high nitrogen upregulated cytochrome P450 monooxygenase 2 [Trametes cingulata]
MDSEEPHGRPSADHSLLLICLLALMTHQLFRYFETFSKATHILLLCAPLLASFQLLRPAMAPSGAACVSAVVFFATLLLSTALYRISPFHRLAKYPGPFPCRLSKFWMACISTAGRQHLYIKGLHEGYGDVVRIGPNELSFNDPSIVNVALGSPGVPKGPLSVGRLLTATDLPLPGIMDPQVHQERRKPWNRAMSANALKEYEPQLSNRATQLVHVLGTQKQDIDIGQFIKFFAYDFMSDMAYGGGSELLRDGDQNNIWDTLKEGMPAATFLSHVPWLAIYFGSIPVVSARVMRLLSHCREYTLQRIRRGTVRKDIFHYLSNEDQPGVDSPPLKQLVDDGVLAIVAGADTTSSALTSLFFCLGTHPAAYKRLQAEIDRFYPPGEDPCDARHHRDMHYLTAVINETLRLYPPVPGGTQRQVPHRSPGVMLGPYFVPPGTVIFLHSYTIQRDPRNFSPFPNDFWPERWLVAAGRASPSDLDIKQSAYTGSMGDASSFAHNEAAFIPFSYGPANCVGKQLAMQEMRTVVSSVMQKFELRLREGWDPREYDEGFKDFFVTTRPAVPVTLRARY